MYVSKFRTAVVVMILSAIICISSTVALLSSSVRILSSGSIGYVVTPETRPSVAHSSEIRAVFFKLQSMAVAPDWDVVMDTLAAYGIDIIIPESLFTFYAMYPSDIVPRGPQIYPEIVDKAHARGIEVHAHMNVLLGTAGSEYAAVTATGGTAGFSSPAKTVVRDRIKALVQEFASMYDIDGFMIDYARYDSQDVPYGPEAKAQFEAYLGETIPDNNWAPNIGGGGDFGPAGSRYNEFMEWRTHPMNDLVRDIGIWLREVNLNIVISAAVWPAYSPVAPAGQKYYLGQDWFYWVKEGYADWIAGMAYTTDLTIIENCVINAHQWGTGGPQGKVPYVSFLADGAEGFGSSDPATFNQLIETSRNAGAEGWVIFSYGGPGENVGYGPDIVPILDAINLYPRFSIENLNASPTGNTYTITWTTTLPATGKVEYNISPLFTASFKPSPSFVDVGYWDVDHSPGTVVEDNASVINHSITLTGLLPGTKYYYRVQSQDANGIATSTVYTFETGLG